MTIISLLLFSLTLASILGAYVYGGRIHGSVLTPTIVGLALLFRRRTTSIEYVRALHELHIEFASTMRRRQVRIPIGEIIGLTVTSPSAEQPDAEHELHLLRKRERSLTLFTAPDATRIEPARALVSSFLLENGLLRDDSELNPSVRARIAGIDATLEINPKLGS